MALLSTIRDLHRRKGRERRGLALAEGVRLVEEMLASSTSCKGVAVAPSLDHTARGVALRSRLTGLGVAVETVADADMAELAATEHPQGIVAVYQPRTWPIEALRPASRHPLVVLDGVQDPGNVGTIARTALAFGASGLLALPGTADLTNPKTVRGAMGALFHLPHSHAVDADLAGVASAAGAEVWVTAGTGDVLESAAPSHPLILVFGNEGSGVRDVLLATATRTLAIPISTPAESLNVSVAAGIVLYQVTR